MPSNVVDEAIAEVYKIPSLGDDLAFDQPYMNSGANGLQARVEVQRVPPFEADNTPPPVVLQVSLNGAEQGRLEVVNFDLSGNERAVEARELGGLRDRLYLSNEDVNRLVEHLQPALAQMVKAYAPSPAEPSPTVARDETLDRISRLRAANFTNAPLAAAARPSRGDAAVASAHNQARVQPSPHEGAPGALIGTTRRRESPPVELSTGGDSLSNSANRLSRARDLRSALWAAHVAVAALAPQAWSVEPATASKVRRRGARGAPHQTCCAPD